MYNRPPLRAYKRQRILFFIFTLLVRVVFKLLKILDLGSLTPKPN